MAKNIVICCDGTGNEIGVKLSNVLKLYRLLSKNDEQLVYYDPGVGTLGQRKTWGAIQQKIKGVLGLATGYGLDDDVLEAYSFLARHYEEGDAIYLFGFSRGAYCVRVVAGLIHLMGLLRPDQLNYVGYALTAYKRASQEEELKIAWDFRRIVGGRRVPIKFLGVWDTVASMIVPRPDRLYVPSLESLPYTMTNPSVEIVRHALAIDEFRRMFRPKHWIPDQSFEPNPFDRNSMVPQNYRQVWFAGCHSDIGGGYSEEESGLSKFPFLWMIEEAKSHGLKTNTAMLNHLGKGHPRKGSSHIYATPDHKARLHKSAIGGWRLLEWLPKRVRARQWIKRRSLLGFYIPYYEPRPISEGSTLHASVVSRLRDLPDYQPVNLPISYEVHDSRRNQLSDV